LKFKPIGAERLTSDEIKVAASEVCCCCRGLLLLLLLLLLLCSLAWTACEENNTAGRTGSVEAGAGALPRGEGTGRASLASLAAAVAAIAAGAG